MLQSGLSSIQGFTEVRLPPKIVFHRRLSSTKGCLPPKFVIHHSCLVILTLKKCPFSTNEMRATWTISYHLNKLVTSNVLRLCPRRKVPKCFWTKQTKQTNETHAQSIYWGSMLLKKRTQSHLRWRFGNIFTKEKKDFLLTWTGEFFLVILNSCRLVQTIFVFSMNKDLPKRI